MKRKKQGASLIVVIIIFMFVSTVSMAMLSMVLGNYKARVAESKRVENLYASDSGLDVAYNIIGKTFDAATKYAYYEVDALKLNDGSNIGPNYYKYKTIQEEIDDLNRGIIDLNKEITELKKETSTDTIKEDIVRKNKLIVQKKSLIEEDENLKKILLNEEFKRAFKNFIARTPTSEFVINEYVPDKLKESIEGTKDQKRPKYVSEVTFDKGTKKFNFTDEIIEFGIQNNKNEPPTLQLVDIGSIENVPIGSVDEPVTINSNHLEEVKNLRISKSPDQEYNNITVKSSFYTETVKTTNTNERQLQASFKMSVPNYKDIYFQNTDGELQEYLALKDRALTIYGDMKVNNADELTVNGEIFVEGKEPKITTTEKRTFEKYNGGIIISNSKGVKFNDDVITRNTFNVRQNVVTTINGNLYGRNVYMGGKYINDNLDNGLDEPASGSTLNVNSSTKDDKGRVVIDNDLALKADDSHINIKEFYGINDKTIDSKDAGGMLVDKLKTSSSIIVNANDKSSIDIKKSAYIMGTAHINTNEKDDSNRYQTGESGAVKGNYIAYSVPFPLDNTTEKFKLYDPLQLLESNVIEKATHFAGYWNHEILNKHYPDSGGIIWPHNADYSIDSKNIHSTGAIVYELNGIRNVVGSTYYQDLEKPGGAVYDKQKDFAIKVYRFNQSATKEYEYDNTILTNFSSLINTANIPSDILSDQTNKGEYAIFNGQSSKEIKITTGTKDKIDTTTDSNVIEIQVAADKNNEYILNAVIATAGKVSIESSNINSNITLNGCIIAKGDLSISGKNISINYDQSVIERVQAQNIDTFKAVFGEGLLINNTASSTSTSDSKNANYDLKNFLENKLWKILK